MDRPDISRLVPELVDKLDDEVYIHTIDGVPLFANRACLDRLGLTLEEFAALPPYGWVPDRVRARIPERIEWLSMHGHARFESTYRLPSGAVGAYEVHASVVAVGGHPVVVGVGRDVTARKRVIEDLELRSTLLDVIGEGLLVHDLHGTIVYANDAAARMHGYGRAELIGRSMSEVAPRETAGGYESRYSAATETVSAEEHVTARGELLHVEARARLVERGERTLVVRVLKPL